MLNAPRGLVPKKAAPVSEESARMALLAARCGEYHRAVTILNSIKPENPSLIKGLWNHPLVYWEYASRAWRLYGIPSELVLSVIRT